ncbi:MAG: hypothetical protein ACXWV9_07860 [Flavisolibacter sp.]
MSTLLSIHWALVASVWYFGNGILHDAFVISKHKGPYNRELLRLLMDGHVLMLSGALVFVSWLMMLNKIQCGALISIIVAAFMLLYCGMIFPFLKSIGTIAISIVLIIVAIKAMISFPNIYDIMKKSGSI